ncbi:MAG: hypothetical protein JWM62_2301 [Frankiales bacterium]|nr:hypothetical protein [Frankiales bacterium]
MRPYAPLMILRAAAALALAAALLAGCSDDEPAATPQTPSASALSAPIPGITLPPDPLQPLVPTPEEVPSGMVPLLSGSGSRDAAAIAEFSADPAAAATALAAHGFSSAYVAQYAHPSDGRVLSVVVARFRDAAGAKADLEGDLAGSSGELVETATVGEASQARRQPLPGGAGQLVTLRFRQGATTWLLAYGAPEADPQVAVELAQALVERATT